MESARCSHRGRPCAPVAVDFGVVVDVHPYLFPFGVNVRMPRQRLQRRLGDYRKLMVISEACFLHQGFLSDRKLQAMITSRLFSLRFKDV